MATKKTAVAEFVAEPKPVMTEDMSATEVKGGPAPADVYAELEAIAEGKMAPPVKQMPVSLGDMAPPLLSGESIDDAGGVVDGELLSFGEKTFFSDPDKRKALPNNSNLAAGPRVASLPAGGEFLEGTKSFRRVPYRTVKGSIRVDN